MAREQVIFLAFADARGDLPELREETRRLQELFERFRDEGRCTLIFRPTATWEQIYEVLTTRPDDIVIFHFGGHAQEGHLLLDSHAGAASVSGEGLASLLGRRRNLKLVFLNGCSTRPQVQGLLDAGVPAVIATARPIEDRAAREIAVAFYEALTAGGESVPAGGRSLRAAFDAANAYVVGRSLPDGRDRHLFAADRPQSAQDVTDGHGLPFGLFVRTGAEEVDRWDLFAADPLFGLPPLPTDIGFPADPYRNLDWFAEEHARIFFGRGAAIRELYDLITRSPKPGHASVILYFGQTGVGKTSVLAAGIVPRLRAKYEVRYRRRDPALGLLGTLAAELAPGSDQFDLGRSWSGIEENHLNRPLVVILDQAEEAYTRPLSGLAPNNGSSVPTASEVTNAEIVALFEAVRYTFDPQDRPRGKLILGFRKEWLGEFENACRARQLAYEPLHLPALDRDGVIEAVEGIVREPDLTAKRIRYRLTITPIAPERPTLAEFMADDLRDRLGEPSASEASPIAPTLQLLLTRMWEVAKTRSDGDRVLNANLYDDLKKSGFKLDEVLARQLGEIERHGGDEVSDWLRDAVRGGLLLDLLEVFTTPMGTAATRAKLELHARYPLQPPSRIEALMEQCKDRYLIAEVKVADGKVAYRLSHDILAPLIRERFRISICTAQRARRLLESRVIEWRGQQVGPAFDRTDLRAVEEGLPWMRGLECDEIRLLEASLQSESRRVSEEEKQQRRLREAEEEAKRELRQRVEAQDAAKVAAESRLKAEEQATQELQGRLRAEEDAKTQAQQRAEDQRKSYGKLRKAAIALLALLVAVLLIALFAGREWTMENKHRKIAEAQTKLANQKSALAEEQAAKATKSKLRALTIQDLAEKSIESLTSNAEELNSDKRLYVQLLINSVTAYNSLINEDTNSDPDLELSKAWTLLRLSKVLDTLYTEDITPQFGANSHYISDPLQAVKQAIILFGKLESTSESNFYNMYLRGGKAYAHFALASILHHHNQVQNAILEADMAVSNFNDDMKKDDRNYLSLVGRGDALELKAHLLSHIGGRLDDEVRSLSDCVQSYDKAISLVSSREGQSFILTAMDYRSKLGRLLKQYADVLYMLRRDTDAKQSAYRSCDLLKVTGAFYDQQHLGKQGLTDFLIGASVSNTLVTNYPNDFKAYGNYVNFLNRIGDSYSQLERFDEALVQFKTASAVIADALGRKIGSAAERFDLQVIGAGVLSNQGSALLGLNKPEDALLLIDQAIDIESKLLHSGSTIPGTDEFTMHNFYTRHWLLKSMVLSKLKRSEDWKTAIDETIVNADQLRQLVDRPGLDPYRMRSTAEIYFGISDSLLGKDNSAGADRYNTGISILEHLVQRETTAETQDLRSLADAHLRYCHILILLERYADAEREVKKASQGFLNLQSHESNSDVYTAAISKTYIEQVYLDLLKKDFNLATLDAQKVRDLSPFWWGPYLQLSVRFISALERFKDDNEFAVRCRNAAFEYLEKAVDLGFKDVSRLQQDGNMEPIRADPRFKQLVSRMLTSRKGEESE